MPRWYALIAALLIAACTAVTPADAQGTSEPPLIAGRIALADGDAQVWRTEEDGNAGQWDAAVVNDVVSAGTGLYTGDDGRNEVRVGPHTFRLGASSRGGFTQLDYATAVFNLEYGALNVRLAIPEHGETTAVTVAGVRVDLVAPGRYRIDTSDRGAMRLTVFDGHGTVRSSSNSAGVGPNQAIIVNAGGGGYQYEAATTTAFDQWALERDDQYRQVRSAQYVSPYMTGYETLDTYGDWSSDATYGMVWYPRAVPVGWAPYRYGQWRWVRPWGWTWVDYAPWGYAPFHYGRWVMVGPRWCWVPGGYVRQPVWAPALVGFVGSGVSVAVSVGGPVVGWYPLAPWHRYEPHYRHSPRYTTIVNQTVIRQPPPGVPHNLTQGPGATVVPGGRFREPIQRVALPAQQRPQELKPMAPPPLNVAPAPRPQSPKFADRDDHPGRPGAPGARQQPNAVQPPAQAQPAPRQPGGPTRIAPPMAGDPVPGRGVAQPPAMPGNDPAPLAQPPGLRRGQPLPQTPAPVAPEPPQRSAPPRPHLPSDQLPPGQPQPTNPAEPARFPPGAPPTIRQPQPMVPAARPVQPSPAQQAPGGGPSGRGLAAPPPVAQPAPHRPAPSVAVQPAPRAAPPAAAPPAAAPPAAAPVPPPQRAHPAPSNKEQVLRGAPEQARGNPPEHARGNSVEREAPPMRSRQAER